MAKRVSIAEILESQRIQRGLSQEEPGEDVRAYYAGDKQDEPVPVVDEQLRRSAEVLEKRAVVEASGNRIKEQRAAAEVKKPQEEKPVVRTNSVEVSEPVRQQAPVAEEVREEVSEEYDDGSVQMNLDMFLEKTGVFKAICPEDWEEKPVQPAEELEEPEQLVFEFIDFDEEEDELQEESVKAEAYAIPVQSVPVQPVKKVPVYEPEEELPEYEDAGDFRDEEEPEEEQWEDEDAFEEFCIKDSRSKEEKEAFMRQVPKVSLAEEERRPAEHRTVERRAERRPVERPEKDTYEEHQEVSYRERRKRAEEERRKKRNRGLRGFLGEVVVFLAVFLICLVIVPTFVLQRTIVDGHSMENQLQDGDQLLVEKISRHFSEYERFDVVVFYPFGQEESTEYYVKRVIALPGETVQIVGDDIYIDGEILDEDYGKDPMTYSGIASEPITLEEGEYFLLGDNREISFDSRYDQIGVVTEDQIEGKAFLRIWPLTSFGGVN